MKYRLKYYSLSKEEKRKLQEKFKKTEYGANILTRLKRLLGTGILAIVFSIIIFVFRSNIWDIVTGVILLMAGILFIVSSLKLKIKNLNNFLIKK